MAAAEVTATIAVSRDISHASAHQKKEDAVAISKKTY